MEKFNEFCTSDFVVKPFFQPFKYPLNTTRGDMFFSVDGKEYKPLEDYVVKEFSTGADRTMPIVYALEDLNLGGVIFKWSKKPNYFKARAFFTTHYPVVCVGPEFPKGLIRITGNL